MLKKWLDNAIADGGLPNPDAMTLATIDANGQPAARIVLCKEISVEQGYLVFYTNYSSAKSTAIEQHAAVAAVFHWDHMNRQARVEGIASKSPAEESDAYFASRDKESQIGAWASSQSQPIETRQLLLNKHAATAKKLSDLSFDTGKQHIPRPPSWGGYRIHISAVELWTRGQARLHDRGRWERSLTIDKDGQADAGQWSAIRLQP
jgi:pyridoxamine 5'-phosphate oxidase